MLPVETGQLGLSPTRSAPANLDPSMQIWGYEHLVTMAARDQQLVPKIKFFKDGSTPYFCPTGIL